MQEERCQSTFPRRKRGALLGYARTCVQRMAEIRTYLQQQRALGDSPRSNVASSAKRAGMLRRAPPIDHESYSDTLLRAASRLPRARYECSIDYMLCQSEE